MTDWNHYVVAPSGSSGNPSAPYSSIQAAINAVAAGPGSGTVHVLQGTYTEDVIARPGIHLKGLAGDGRKGLVKVVGSIALDAGAGTFCVEDLWVEGAGPALSAQSADNQVLDLRRCALLATTSGHALDVVIAGGTPGDTTKVTAAQCLFKSPDSDAVALVCDQLTLEMTDCDLLTDPFASGQEALNWSSLGSARFVRCSANGFLFFDADPSFTAEFLQCNLRTTIGNGCIQAANSTGAVCTVYGGSLDAPASGYLGTGLAFRIGGGVATPGATATNPGLGTSYTHVASL